MSYLLSDLDLVNAAQALHEAQEEASSGEQGGAGIPGYLYTLLSVSDDTRAKLVADPNWLMGDHSDDGHWEEAQEAFARWEEADRESWIEEMIEKHDYVWAEWVQPVRDLVAAESR